MFLQIDIKPYSMHDPALAAKVSSLYNDNGVVDADVWFDTDRFNSVDLHTAAVPADIAALYDVKGTREASILKWSIQTRSPQVSGVIYVAG